MEVELFYRSPRGLVATELGHLVVFRFRRCLAELRHVDSDLSALKGTVQRIVKVGALASAGKDSDFAALPGVDTLEVSLAAVRNT